MKNTAQALRRIVDEYVQKLRSLSESEFHSRPSSEKWSKKEVIGHLIDSAHSNYRRFLTGQYEPTPPKIHYDQEFWVEQARYQDMESEDLITLWKLMNERICIVLENMAPEKGLKQCDTGKTAVELHTIEWLASDYVKHLKHHLNQVFVKAFDIVYP